MPVPRGGAGGYVDLNQGDQFPPGMGPHAKDKPGQQQGLFKMWRSAMGAGQMGKGSPTGVGEPGTPPATGGVAEPQPPPSGWETFKNVTQQVFPGSAPYFKAGAAVGDWFNAMDSQRKQASKDAGYAPSSPATATLDWARDALRQEEGP